MEKKELLVCRPSIVRKLIRLGYACDLIDIRPYRNSDGSRDTDRSIYVFDDNNDGLREKISELSLYR